MELGAFVMKVKALACLIRGLTPAIAIVPAFLAGMALAVDMNQRGFTGTWHDPATTGQAVQFEVYPNAVAPGIGYLQGSWATLEPWLFPWDYIGVTRWYTFGGTVVTGQSEATFVLYQNTGGNFNAPPATSPMPVGTAALSLEDCSNATITFTFTGESGFRAEWAFPLVRLLPSVICAVDGENPTHADTGYSGNWVASATPGQGFVFELNPDAAVVFFVWYTYASNGQSQGTWGHRWYTGQARYVPGSRTLPVTLFETGVRDNRVNDGGLAALTQAVGTATATFVGCRAASLTFAFTGGGNAGASGTISLSRVGPTPPGCDP